MDAAHLHLMLNHLPVLGTLFGALLLLAALALKKLDLRAAAMVTLVLAGASSWPAFATGGQAEEIVEAQANVSYDALEAHEDAAKFANLGGLVLAALALVTLLVSPRRPAAAPVLSGVTLLLALLVVAMMARTAYLGGSVAHPELRSPGLAAAGGEAGVAGGEAREASEAEHEAGDGD